ncbi:TPA: hypothetical protein ACS70L_001919 [Providencia alcalifaciens]
MKLDEFINDKFKIENLVVYPKIEDVEKYNAYLRLLYTRNINSMSVKELLPLLFSLKIDYDAFHFHWIGINNIKSCITTLIVLLIAIKFRLYGKSVIWTLHNKYPHNKVLFKLNKFINKIAARLSNHLHVHSNSAIDIMSDILHQEKDKFFVFPHPDYEVTTFSPATLEDKKQKLGLNNNDYVILIPGIVSEYKKVLETLKCLSQYDAKIIILGKAKCNSESYLQEIKKIVNQSNNIEWFDKFVSDSDMDMYHQMCDIAIFNYEDILTSGSVIRSLNCHTVTLAPKQGCIKDLENKNLFLFNQEKEIPEIINLLKKPQ